MLADSYVHYFNIIKQIIIIIIIISSRSGPTSCKPLDPHTQKSHCISACLHAAGKLQPGQSWRQAGILDTVFEGSVQEAPEGGVIPTVKGRAFVTAENDLILHSNDPFAAGIGQSR